VTTALLLKRGGARVAVIEADAVASGATGCTTAKVSALQATILSTVRSRHGEAVARTYAQASSAAVDMVEELARVEAVDCDLERRPACTYAADEGELGALADELAAARDAGLPVDGPGAAADLPYPIAGAVRLERQLQFQPVRYVRGRDPLPQAMAISAGSPTRSVRSYGDRLIVGGEGHSAGSADATPERFRRLEEFTRRHWDVVAITHRWSAQDPMPYDHLPAIG